MPSNRFQMLHLETVEPHTFSVLKQLMEMPELKGFSLVGGTIVVNLRCYGVPRAVGSVNHLVTTDFNPLLVHHP